MTSIELYEKMKNCRWNDEVETGQLTSYGLSVYTAGFFSKLIKDAARCNRFNSDVVYDINTVNDSFKNFNSFEEYEPIWIGFRKDGVDNTAFLLGRVTKDNLWSDLNRIYFALYSVKAEKDEGNFYKVHFTEYAV